MAVDNTLNFSKYIIFGEKADNFKFTHQSKPVTFGKGTIYLFFMA